MKSNLSMFSFVAHDLGVISKNHCQIHCHQTFLLYFLLRVSYFCSCCQVMPNSLRHHGLKCTRPLCPSLSPGACPSSSPLNWRCHPTISSSVVHFSFCLQSFPASGSFPVSRLFASNGQSIGTSTSASVLPMSIQGWFPLGLTGLISFLSRGLSRVSYFTKEKLVF